MVAVLILFAHLPFISYFYINMRNKKYTDEQIIQAVYVSDSMYGVLRNIGASVKSGATWTLIKNRIIKLNLSTSHFKRPTDIRADNNRLPWEKVLVYDRLNGKRESTVKLKRCMIEYGIKEICSCGQGLKWNDKILNLQIEHKNGNPIDNKPENLEFLCPNCHSQTSTFCGKNKEGTATMVE